MSFSDFILTALVIIGISGVVWVLDLNPYSKQFQVYSQSCDKMILEDTFCKGVWQDNPTRTFVVSEFSDQVVSSIENVNEPVIYNDCTTQDRKNWSCIDASTQEEINVKDGMIIYSENNNIRQITRLEWLQNKFLTVISK
ncbi:MAG: hypothetical protein AB8B92_11185 [Gammaproteobacteria bacterium]